MKKCREIWDTRIPPCERLVWKLAAVGTLGGVILDLLLGGHI